jgi:hypothetical protein
MTNPLTEALHSVFGPIAKQSAKWPAPLAYGFPAIVAVLLIAALGLVVTPGLLVLFALVILAPLIGFIMVERNTREGAIEPDATIDVPGSKTTVDRTIHCSGFAFGIPRDKHVWLAVEAMGFIWPKEREVSVRARRWNHTIFEDGAAEEFSVVLLVADLDGHNFIRAWLEEGKAQGEYAEIRGIPGADRLARVENLRLNP